MNWRMQRPPWWGLALLALGLWVFGSLSHWQWRRAAEKELLLRDYALAKSSIPLVFEHGEQKMHELMRGFVPVSVGGQTQAILLRDNQPHQSNPGVHVLRLIKLHDGRELLVNEGWWPIARDRTMQAWPKTAFSDDQIIFGFLVPWPKTPSWLQMNDAQSKLNGYPLLVQLNRDAVQKQFPKAKLADGIVLRFPEKTSAFVREWHPNVFPPERHRGYAMTWAKFFVLSMFLFWLLNRQKSP